MSPPLQQLGYIAILLFPRGGFWWHHAWEEVPLLESFGSELQGRASQLSRQVCYPFPHDLMTDPCTPGLWVPSRAGGKQQRALQLTLHRQDVWKSITNLYMALFAEGAISLHSNAAGVYTMHLARVWDLAQVRDTAMETPAGEGAGGLWAESPICLAQYQIHCGHQPRDCSMLRVVASPMDYPSMQIGLKKYISHCQEGKLFFF